MPRRGYGGDNNKPERDTFNLSLPSGYKEGRLALLAAFFKESATEVIYRALEKLWERRDQPELEAYERIFGYGVFDVIPDYDALSLASTLTNSSEIHIHVDDLEHFLRLIDVLPALIFRIQKKQLTRIFLPYTLKNDGIWSMSGGNIRGVQTLARAMDNFLYDALTETYVPSSVDNPFRILGTHVAGPRIIIADGFAAVSTAFPFSPPSPVTFYRPRRFTPGIDKTTYRFDDGEKIPLNVKTDRSDVYTRYKAHLIMLEQHGDPIDLIEFFFQKRNARNLQ